MAVLTRGDIKAHIMRVLGIETTDARSIAVIEQNIETAHNVVLADALAAGATWTERMGVRLDITATTTSIPLPDGVTVTDHDGNIPVACSVPMRVKLVSLGTTLYPKTKEQYELEFGDLAYTSRGVPRYWDSRGVDATGRKLLWLMPYPASADQIELDYIGGWRALSSDTQELMCPRDYRELVQQEALANCAGHSGFDPEMTRRAERNAERLWRSARALQFAFGPKLYATPQVVGTL